MLDVVVTCIKCNAQFECQEILLWSNTYRHHCLKCFCKLYPDEANVVAEIVEKISELTNEVKQKQEEINKLREKLFEKKQDSPF